MKTNAAIILLLGVLQIPAQAQIDETNARTSTQCLEEGLKVFEIERGWMGSKITQGGEDLGLQEVYWDRFGCRMLTIRTSAFLEGTYMDTRTLMDGDKIVTATYKNNVSDHKPVDGSHTTHYSAVENLVNFTKPGLTYKSMGMEWSTEAVENSQVLGFPTNGLNVYMDGRHMFEIQHYSGIIMKQIKMPMMTEDQASWIPPEMLIQMTTEEVTEAIVLDLDKPFGDEVFTEPERLISDPTIWETHMQKMLDANQDIPESSKEEMMNNLKDVIDSK